MPRIEVEPGELTAGSARQHAAAGRLLEVGGELQVAASGAACAAGDPGLSSAIGEWGAAWAGALGTLAASVGATSSNLGAAATAYAQTDLQAMPSGLR